MPNIAELRKNDPDLEGLDDDQVVEVMHQAYYSDLPREEVAKALGVKPPAEPVKPRGMMGVAKDIGVSALKGAIGVPEAAVGLADIVTGGRVGKALENDGGAIGFRPKEAKAMLDEQYSEQQKQAFQEVQAARGLGDTFMAAVRNPSVVGHSVVESLPSMGAGGMLARGGLAVAPKIGGVIAGALGEGVVGAGSSAEQIRQQTPDGLLTGQQAALAGATGVATTGFSMLGGKIAQKLGIADVDTMLSGAATYPAVRQGVVRSALEGAVSEGVLEELPQSVSEQVLQNLALGKPLDEGVDQAAVLGLLSGAAMGGGANAISSFMGNREPAATVPPVIVPENGALSHAANLAGPSPALEQAPMEPPPEPIIDPVLTKIQSLPDDVRGEALAAYNVLNRPDAPKGAKQYNKQLLDNHLNPKPDAEQKPAAAQESTAPAATETIAPETPQATEQAPVADDTPPSFASMQEAQDFISQQRRNASIKLPAALPVEFADNTFGIAVDGSPSYAEAQRQDEARQMIAAGVQEGDLLNAQNKPFTTRQSADRLAKETGGELVELAVSTPGKRRYVVRPQPQGKPDVSPSPAVPATDSGSNRAGRAEPLVSLDNAVGVGVSTSGAVDASSAPSRAASEPALLDTTGQGTLNEQDPPADQTAIKQASPPAEAAPAETPAIAGTDAVGATAAGKPAGNTQLQTAGVEQNPAVAQAERAPAATKNVADYSQKWFGAKDKAQAFIDKQKAGGTHEVTQQGKRWVVVQKKQATTKAMPAPTAIETVASDFSKDLNDARTGLADLQERRKKLRGEKRVDIDAQIERVKTAIAEIESQQKEAPALDYSALSAIETVAKDMPKEQDFVQAPNGSLNYGEITADMSKAMGRQAGMIRLQHGVQRQDGSGYGIAHIEARHGKEIKKLGFDSVQDFVKSALQSIDQMWQPGETTQIIAIVSGSKGRAVFLELKPAKDDAGDFYAVNSAFPVGKEYTLRKERKEGWKTLWSRYPVPADASGASGFVDQSPKAGETAPMDGQQSAAVIVPKPASTGKIDDSGAVLEGARKLYAKAYADKLGEGMAMDVAAVPLSKSWPEPDYQRMLDDGADPWAVSFAHAARDEVPNKPTKSWKLKGWVDKVDGLRKFAAEVIDGKYTRAAIEDKARTTKVLGDWLNKVDLYEAVGHTNSLKGLTFSQGQFSMYARKTYSPPKTMWTISQPSTSAQATWSMGNWSNELAIGDTKAEAISKYKAFVAAQGDKAPAAKAATRFDIYSYRGKPGFVIGKKIGTGKHLDLKTFDTAKEAREFKSANQAELERLLSAAKDVPPERRETNLPRVGADHRNGADVTTEQFRETFGFRGEQFGASMPQDERQANMNQSYDALMDLAGVIGVPPKALSLNGELGLAFGARGIGGKNAPMAHYEADTTGAVTPNRVVINLTRKNGAGSLAHEWFHAVDNYFARARGEKGGFLTNNPQKTREGVRPEMVAAFNVLMRVINTSSMRERAKNLDKRRTKDYWSTGLEMAARSFESYVIAKLQDQNAANDYLANIVSEQEFKTENAYPYPTAGELPQIRAAFDHFFDVVQTREDDTGNVAMFSRRPEDAAEPDAEEVHALAALSKNDELFALPKSDKTTLEGIVADAQAGITVSKGKNVAGREVYTFTMPDGKTASLTVRPFNPYADETAPTQYGYTLKDGEMTDIVTARPGTNPEDVPPTDDVWIDVSKLEQGTGGLQIYNIAATYAHNTGKLFIGDPAGLSDDAMRRRTEQMLSSALKFGTTAHLAPHPRQVAGDKSLGIPPLKWTYGDDLGNIRALIETSLANYSDVNPFTFEPSTGRFLDSQGDVANERALSLAGKEGPGRAAGAGRKTLQRTAIFESLVREGRGKGGDLRAKGGEGILGRLVGVTRQSGVSTAKIFYSQPGAATAGRTTSLAAQAQANSAVEAQVNAIKAKWANAPKIVVAFDMQDAEIPQEIRDADLKQRSGGAMGAPEGFYYQGKVYLMSSQLKTPQDTARVLFHEALGHAGLRGVFGDALKPILQQIVAVRSREVDAKIKEYGLHGVNAVDRLTAAEEVLAEMAEKTPEIGFVKRAIAAIRTWLRANVPGFEKLEMSDAEIVRDYLLPARGWIIRGEQVKQADFVPTFGRALNDAGFAGNIDKNTGGRDTSGDGTPDTRPEAAANIRVLGSAIARHLGIPGATVDALHPYDARVLPGDAALREVAESFGSRIQGFDLAPNLLAADKTRFGFFSGVRTGGVVFVRSGLADRPHFAVLGHELAHELATKKPALYRQFVEAIRPYIDQKKYGAEFVNSVVAQNAGNADKKREEFIGEVLSDGFMEREFWRALGNKNPSLLRKIGAAVMDLVERALRTLGYTKRAAPYLTDYKKVMQIAGEVMAEFGAEPSQITQFNARFGASGQTEAPRFSRTALAESISGALKAVTVTDIKASAGNKLADYRGLGLQFLGGRQLNDLYGKDIPQLPEYTRMVQQMAADANAVGANADLVATSWGNLPDERKLAELMHDATLAQIDAAKDFVTGDNRTEWSKLRAAFRTLSPAAQKVYLDARDGYEEHYTNVREAIRDKIERSDMAKPAKAAMLERMDGEFFDKIKGVYFPLARFGKYVVVTRKGPDVVNVSRAETLNEAESLRISLRKDYPASGGYNVGKVLRDKEFNAARDSVGRGFLKDLFGVLDKEGVGEELQDAVNQLYLASMPDLSWAKHGIHRKGTPGFSQDARRAYAQNMFHGARYLAKLRYADQLQDKLTDMQSHVEQQASNEAFDSVKGQQVVDELTKRNDSLMNPNSNPLSTALTSFGFVFHLGLSPASAMVNLSQTALMAYPIMGAKWGFDKAAAALAVAGKQAAINKNDISSALNTDERRAYDEAVKAGTIDVTNAHDLAGIAQGEDAGVMWKLRPVMKWASFLFHHAERFNRQITFVASYRLARDAGVAHDVAFEQATKATYDGHFDYASSNRPRVMQGNAAKVLLLFKQYGQNMIYTLVRQAQLAIKAETPEGRKEARKALGGLLVTHASAAGVLGLPLVGSLLAAASMLGGSDDEPWDAEAALRNMLADTFGQKAGEVLAHGFSRLTPWDISGRVGLDRLIFPDIQEGLQGQRLGESAMAAALGPVAGIGINALKGMQEISEGRMARGLESMMPAALRGPMKAIRYGTEGNVDKTGIVLNEDIGLAGVAGQALGFSPSEARNAQEGRSAIYQIDAAIRNRRASLMRQFAQASMAGDEDGKADAREDIKAFNAKNPKVRILPAQLALSVRARQRRIREAEGGVYLPKSRRDAVEAGRFSAMEE